MYKIIIISLLSFVISGCNLNESKSSERVVPEVDIESQQFINDPEIIGIWRAADFVKSIDSFSPGIRSWRGDLIYDLFIFKPNGETHKPYFTWSKGKVFHSGDKSQAKYLIKNIDGQPYLFLEHISKMFYFEVNRHIIMFL